MKNTEKFTLRELREQSGKTAAEVAKALGVTVRAVARYEQGTRRMSFEQILTLMKLYNYTAEEILKAQLNSCR